MIQIGKYIEIAIQWLTENFAPFFDAVNSGIGGGIDVFNQALLWIPFYLFKKQNKSHERRRGNART